MSKTFAIGEQETASQLDAKFEKTRNAAIGVYQKMRKFFPTGEADNGIWFVDDGNKRVAYIHAGPMIRLSFTGPRSCSIGVRVLSPNSSACYEEITFNYSFSNSMRNTLMAAFGLGKIGFMKNDIGLCVFKDTNAVLRNRIFFGIDGDVDELARYRTKFDIGVFDVDTFVTAVCGVDHKSDFAVKAFKHTHNSSLVSPATYMNLFLMREGESHPVFFKSVDGQSPRIAYKSARPYVNVETPDGKILEIPFGVVVNFGAERAWNGMVVLNPFMHDDNGRLIAECSYTEEVKQPWQNMKRFTANVYKSTSDFMASGKVGISKPDTGSKTMHLDTGLRADWTFGEPNTNPDFEKTFKTARLGFDCLAAILYANTYDGCVKTIKVISVPVTPKVDTEKYPFAPLALGSSYHAILLELEIVDRIPQI